MFLLVSGRHVSAHTDGHQHDVSIQISINLGKKFLRILAKVFAYLLSFISHILDLISWTILILILFYFEWHDTENQQLVIFYHSKVFLLMALQSFPSWGLFNFQVLTILDPKKVCFYLWPKSCQIQNIHLNVLGFTALKSMPFSKLIQIWSNFRNIIIFHLDVQRRTS